MQGKSLKTAIKNLSLQYPDATFLVDGNSLRGYIDTIEIPTSTEFLFICDYMAAGTAAPEILSSEYISLRADALNNPLDSAVYAPERYEQECASVLRGITKREHSEIILLQFDCFVSQIWQLTMMAYIEQSHLCDSIKRLCFYDDCESDFIASRFDEISVTGSHDAFCRLLCRHEVADLSNYLISKEAVNCYLDINSPNGLLYTYIVQTSSAFKDPFVACGEFLRDFKEWGLGDGDFLKIAYRILSQDVCFKDTARSWKQKILSLRSNC